MFDIKPYKPGPSTDIIMGIGAQKRSAVNKLGSTSCFYNGIIYEIVAPKNIGPDLFIEINLAKAPDMTYISPEPWRKYLLNTQERKKSIKGKTNINTSKQPV